MRVRQILLMSCFVFLGGCSAAFKNSNIGSDWDCSNAKGIGCSSIEFADEIARQKIVLNESLLVKSKKKRSVKAKKVLINEHDQDFAKQPIEMRGVV